MPASANIACPLNFESLVTPGIFEGLTALELGALARLILAAWRETPPCTLPGDDIVLAMVARQTEDEWTRTKPRVFAALAAEPTDGGRIAFRHAVRVHQELAARVAADVEQRRAAGRASAAARRGDPPPPPGGPPGPTGGQRPLNGRSTSVERALNERSTGVGFGAPTLSLIPVSSALSLERSNPESKSERSERSDFASARALVQEPAGDVIAAINADVKGLLEQRIREWRSRQARVILERAIDQWRATGLTDCPTSKAISLARLASATPARCDYLVTYANDLVSAYEAAKAAGKNPDRPKLIGALVAGLGAREHRPSPPWDVPLIVAQRWQEAEAHAVRAIEVQASINSRLASLTNPASTDQSGVRPGGGRA